MMDYRRRRSRGSRIGTVLVAVAVIVVVVAALMVYEQAPTSTTVYCGVLQYIVFPAQSISKSHTTNVTQTMTTTVAFTTTTVPGQVGRTYSNSTTTVSSGYSAGVETICKYIPNVSTSTSAPK